MMKHTKKQSILSSFSHFLKTLGPGLSMAGAAIGVSHLVQSTRAGADFGFSLILLIIVTNLLKLPFFEIGHRYAYATGENLLDGLHRLSPKILKIYFIINIFTGICTNAGVFLVTAGLIQTLFPYDWVSFPYSTLVFSGLLFLGLVAFIIKGEFEFFDKVMKGMMIVLSITTLSAFIFSLAKFDVHKVYEQSGNSFLLPLSSLPFLLALMGWMPAPIEVSTWQSLWCQEKVKQLKKLKIPLNEKWAMHDFYLGYFLTIALAIVFVVLGAMILFSKGIILQDSALGFSTQLIGIFTQAIGPWSKYIISICCVTTMISTALTCLDGYSRMFIQAQNRLGLKSWNVLHSLCLFSIPSFIILIFLSHRLKFIIDFVTTMSFLCAPFFSYLNLKIIGLSHVPDKFKLSPLRRRWCWLGIFFLALISILYILN